MDGQTLQLRAPVELISEAALPGTVQLPPSGQPIVLMAEAPVTGGYPRIGQVAAVDLPRLAQRRPGDAVCFRHDTLEHAITRLAEREQALDVLLEHVAHRLQQDGSVRE
jgi:antagonist of KipI